MGGCNCGKSRLGGTKKWNLLDSSGKVIKTYSSEVEARMAASRTSGAKVRAA